MLDTSLSIHNLGSFHSLDKPKFIFVDEGDFFPVGQLEEIRHVSERYIAKSNPYIAMVSTPNNPGGLFEQIENEPVDSCLHQRLFLDYRVGLGKIYSIHDIEKAKQSPSFEREYNLKYGIGTGNVFIGSELDRACNLIKYPIQVDHSCVLSLGLDLGWGSSRFAAAFQVLQDDIIKVVYIKEWENTSYESVMHKVSRLKMQFKPAKIYCDGSNPNFIKSLKSIFDEAQDYDKVIQIARKSKI